MGVALEYKLCRLTCLNGVPRARERHFTSAGKFW